jgi:hypothetical protein
VAFMNVTDAIYLASVNHDLTDESHPIKIIKKDAEYLSETITFLNSEGNLIEDRFVYYDVWWIFNVSPDYICMFGEFEMAIYEDSKNVELYTSILVRKSDGAIFNFNGHYLEGGSFYMGQKYPQKDQNEAIYYSSDFDVYKLNVTDPDNLTQKKYLPDNQKTDRFFIDADGNCFYNGLDNYFTKIKKASVGIIENSDHELNFLWNGYDHKTYWLNAASNETDPNLTQCSVSEIRIEGDQINSTMISNHYLNFPNIYFNKLLYDTSAFSTQLLFNTSRYGIIGEIFREDVKSLVPIFMPIELSDEQNLPVEMSNNKVYQVISVSGNSIYLILQEDYNDFNYAGDEIIQLDIREYEADTRIIQGESVSGLAYTDFLTFSMPEGYEIYSLVPSFDNILFSALRYSDEKNVLMIIDKDGKLTQVEETGNVKYSELQRLN